MADLPDAIERLVKAFGKSPSYMLEAMVGSDLNIDTTTFWSSWRVLRMKSSYFVCGCSLTASGSWYYPVKKSPVVSDEEPRVKLGGNAAAL